MNRDFQKDENRSEISFPSSLTAKEVNFLVDEAKEMGLHTVLPSNKVSSLLIIIWLMASQKKPKISGFPERPQLVTYPPFNNNFE